MRVHAPRLDFAAVDRLRRNFHRSVLLFITDRCPVGCEHCSVDSRPDSDMIVDHEEFGRIVRGIAALDSVELVGISGGEPFVERRGLEGAVAVLRAADKLIVPYTSGVWARRAVPAWVSAVLEQSSAVFLSTDAFHARHIDESTFERAAQAIAGAGAGLIVQAIGVGDGVRDAERLIDGAFGRPWPNGVEINVTQPLSYGRGAEVFQVSSTHPGATFGPCAAVASPVIRYDGVAAACCNEQVIVGLGPTRLRTHVADGQVSTALDLLASDPLIRSMHDVGPGPLTAHPALEDLAAERFTNICDMCWKTFERVPLDGSDTHRFVAAASAVLGSGR